ncbi:MAG: hypothetical protein JXA81_13425 [Sedimentisphaerales bacterium]|nr:hypothetical protein [Sedimentisphaerales bacterium]
MADTSYLKKTVEPFLLRWTAQQIDVELKPCKVVVGHAMDGSSVRFEFDGVSDDGTVGICISASSSYKVGQMRKFFMEATLLNRIPQFKRRIMVFVEKHVWEGFKNQCDGLVDLDRIEGLICSDLPQDMRAKIAEIYKVSAEEVGDRSGRGIKVPGRRR